MLRHKEPTGKATYATDTQSNRTKVQLLQKHAKQRKDELKGRPGWRFFGTVSSRSVASTIDDTSKSCFWMQAAKQFHHVGFPENSKNFAYNYNELDESEVAEQRRKEYFIKRHEEALHKRRSATAKPKVIKKPSQYVEPIETGPSLLNPYHQELAAPNDVPLMTKMMKGAYYKPPKTPPPVKANFVALNRQNVRTASAVNRIVGQR